LGRGVQIAKGGGNRFGTVRRTGKGGVLVQKRKGGEPKKGKKTGGKKQNFKTTFRAGKKDGATGREILNKGRGDDSPKAGKGPLKKGGKNNLVVGWVFTQAEKTTWQLGVEKQASKGFGKKYVGSKGGWFFPGDWRHGGTSGQRRTLPCPIPKILPGSRKKQARRGNRAKLTSRDNGMKRVVD